MAFNKKMLYSLVQVSNLLEISEFASNWSNNEIVSEIYKTKLNVYIHIYIHIHLILWYLILWLPCSIKLFTYSFKAKYRLTAF